MLQKQINRLRRKVRVRAKISWTAQRPRLSIFRSWAHIYAQLIDDVTGCTLASASDLKADKVANTQKAIIVWNEIADKAKKINIIDVVFDRGGFSYHGRVKSLADAAREGGLKF
jgi:large subunit ribosomal protein L18